MRKSRRIISTLLLVVMLSMIFGSTPALAVDYYNDEGLISSVSVPSEGQISFKLKVPDWADSTYRIVYKDAPTVQVKSGTYSTTGTERFVTVTVDVPHYDGYIIKAGYGGYCTDEDSVEVKMLTTHYTNKYTWTNADVTNYYANQFIGNFAIGLSAALLTKRLYVGVGTGAGMSTLSTYLQSGDPTLAYSKVPSAGYSWQYKLVPATSGIKYYLSVWDANNTKIVTDYYVGTTSY